MFCAFFYRDQIHKTSIALFHCFVRQGPEVVEYLRRLGRIHHALAEKDANHSFRGIDVGRGTEATSPTEPARGVEDLAAADVHGHAETPTGMGAEEDFRACALLP